MDQFLDHPSLQLVTCAGCELRDLIEGPILTEFQQTRETLEDRPRGRNMENLARGLHAIRYLGQQPSLARLWPAVNQDYGAVAGHGLIQLALPSEKL
ncbi:MAG: hypothetical protein M9894_00675 [Planctomycetes bacterium]|nr:hypothetical protein [Planctomycetota bacterium]